MKDSSTVVVEDLLCLGGSKIEGIIAFGFQAKEDSLGRVIIRCTLRADVLVEG
jgi:hypothetical protein